MKMMTIASGSSGNCTYVGSENTGILVDVGVSKKKILDALQDVDRTFADINGIVITHEHIDHIRGLGVISRAYGIPIYATEATIEVFISCSFGAGAFHAGEDWDGSYEPEAWHEAFFVHYACNL